MRKSEPGRFSLGRDGATHRIGGALTFETVAEVRAALSEGLGPGGWSAGAGGDEHVFDLNGVNTVDSAGLALLVQWHRAARGAGGRIRFEGVPDALRAIARLCNVDAHLFGQEPNGRT